MSPTEKFRLERNHFRRSGNNGSYSLFHVYQKTLTKYWTCSLLRLEYNWQHLMEEKLPGVITIDDPVSRAPNLSGLSLMMHWVSYIRVWILSSSSVRSFTRLQNCSSSSYHSFLNSPVTRPPVDWNTTRYHSVLEIVFIIAAPAFDILFIGFVYNTKIGYTTAEKLTFEAFYWPSNAARCY